MVSIIYQTRIVVHGMNSAKEILKDTAVEVAPVTSAEYPQRHVHNIQ